VIGSEIQNLFSGGIFQARSFGQYFFSKQVFKFSAFSFGGVFFVGIISGWFCRVAEIGFKIFSLCFGLVCSSFGLLCFVASVLFAVGCRACRDMALQGFQNRLVFSWQ